MSADDERPKPIQDPETGRFQPGNNGGPGRPKGSRNKLGEAFLADMMTAWEAQGQEAIARVIEERPQDFLKVVAGILPKEMNVNVRDIDAMTSEELDGHIASLAATIKRLEGGPGRGNEAEAGAAPSNRTH